MFLGVELLVAPGVLVPREETELLGKTAVAAAKKVADEHGGEVTVVDMCCGSGNLACAVAVHVPGARVWASDLTPACIDLAQKNVASLGLGARVTVVQGDLFTPLAELVEPALARGVDLVVCNPPYISTGKLAGESASLLEREPREAFDGGPYGLTIHQRVIKDSLAYLKDGGSLLFEMGLGQERQLRLLFDRTRAYGEIDLVADEGGRPRVAIGRVNARRAMKPAGAAPRSENDGK